MIIVTKINISLKWKYPYPKIEYISPFLISPQRDTRVFKRTPIFKIDILSFPRRAHKITQNFSIESITRLNLKVIEVNFGKIKWRTL